MSTFTTNAGLNLHYEITGCEDTNAETCLLIAGLTRDRSIWRDLLPQLAQKYKVISFDNRDIGESSIVSAQYQIEELANDTMELIHKLCPTPTHVIGHSMGGFIALHVAAKLKPRVKSLTLCSTAAKQVPEAVAYLKERVRLIDANNSESAATNNEKNIRAVMDKLYCAKSLKAPTFVDNIIHHETSNPHPQTTNSLKHQAVACIQHDAEHLLPDISCPTLIVTGEYDRYYTQLT